MTSDMISLREKKKAKTKLALLEGCLERIGEGTFRSVLVEDICQHAEVSKVTFFKFFPQKEDLLTYFMSIWQAECFVELSNSSRRGLEAIRYIFAKVIEDGKKHPGIMLSLISFLSEQRMHPCVPALSEAELFLLFPDEANRSVIAERSLYDIFKKSVEEARADGHLTTRVSDEEAVVLLFSMFYGAYLSAHLFRANDFMAFYEMHLKSLVK